MNLRNLLAATLVFAVPAIAYAAPPSGTVPEPETIALLGIGAVALVVARRCRKK